MVRRSDFVPLIALCLVAGMGAACANSPGGHAASSSDAPSRPQVASGAAAVVSARVVCRLVADNAGAAAARVRGVDGAPSVVGSGGRDYWLFGDTLRQGADRRDDVIPASVATSDDLDGGDCVRLDFKQAHDGAEPLFPRGDETTAWPDGALALDDGSLAFYMVKVKRESPFAWHVQSIGLGRVAAGSVDGVRAVETIWDERSGFGSRISGARSPVRDGDDVITYLRTDAGANYVARAPLARMGEAAAYTYWTGAAWSPHPQDARPMWPVERGALPADNGVAVSRDPRTGEWLAVYDGDLATVRVRTADTPWGPWSDPVTWLDCRVLVEDVYPYCYSAELHRELSRDPDTLYITFSSQKPYDVTLVELRLGVAVHEWRAADGARRYATSSPGPEWADAGVAFYASERPALGLAPVYLRDDGTYGLDAPNGAAPAFYADASASGGAIPTTPVYRWRSDGREVLGTSGRDAWGRGDVAFYVACLEAASRSSF